MANPYGLGYTHSITNRLFLLQIPPEIDKECKISMQEKNIPGAGNLKLKHKRLGILWSQGAPLTQNANSVPLPTGAFGFNLI